MADRITDLSPLTVPANSDELAIEDVSGNATMKITREDFLTGAPLPANTVDNQSVQNDGVLPGKWSNLYSFRAFEGTTTTLTDNTVVTIGLNTESYDFNNNFTAGAYTAPVNGVYYFNGMVAHATASATPVEALSLIYVNGAAALRGMVTTAPTAAAGSWPVSGELQLTAGDVVTLRHFQNSAGNETTATGTTFTWLSGHIVHRVN